MASGDLKENLGWRATYKLLDGVTATSDGVWVDCGLFTEGRAHLAPGTGTLQLRGSDEDTKPANNTDGYQIGSDVTAVDDIEVAVLPRWIKVKVSAHTSGTHNAWVTFRR